MSRFLSVYHRVGLYLFFVASSAIAASEAANTPVATKGVAVLVDGTQWAYRSEYWVNPCVWEHGKLSGHGLHDEYIEAYWRMQEAETPSALLGTVTAASRDVFNDDAHVARTAAHNAEQNRTKTPEERRVGGHPERFFFTVRCEDRGTDRIFLAMGRGSVLDQNTAPFDVQALTREDGVWKLDLKQRSHPVSRELQAGAWKQFGAPSDAGDHAAYKEQQRKAKEAFDRAATRPTKARRSSTKPSVPTTAPNQ